MEALTEAAEFLGEERLPTSGEYTRIRQQLLEAEAGQENPRPIPALNGFQRRFGGWGKVKDFYLEWRAAEDRVKGETKP